MRGFRNIVLLVLVSAFLGVLGYFAGEWIFGEHKPIITMICFLIPSMILVYKNKVDQTGGKK